jgi:phage shock protein E
MKITKKLAGFLLLISIVFTFAGCDASSNTQPADKIESEIKVETENPEIVTNDAHEKIAKDENLVLIDVRTPEEHIANHISDDILIPLDTLDDILNNSAINLNDEIIVYCRSGRRSLEAQGILESLGYKNVKSMAGGINNWISSDYGVCSGNTHTC